MKTAQHVFGILFAFFLMIILLITSVEIVSYRIPGYYRYEFTKYSSDDRVGISMDELLRVKDDMMSYLKGKKENLSDITATIKGKKNTPFFNEREISHMEDVRALFLKAVLIRRILFVFCIVLLFLIKIGKGDAAEILFRTLPFGMGAFLGIFILMLALIASDFSKYFILFHHIFFDNELWMLDPATDNLINIVPEGFFFETAALISLVFILLSIIILLISKRMKKHLAGIKKYK